MKVILRFKSERLHRQGRQGREGKPGKENFSMVQRHARGFGFMEIAL